MSRRRGRSASGASEGLEGCLVVALCICLGIALGICLGISLGIWAFQHFPLTSYPTTHLAIILYM